jgi:hypothetical protein
MQQYTQHPRHQTGAQANSKTTYAVQAVFTAFTPKTTEEFFH